MELYYEANIFSHKCSKIAAMKKICLLAFLHLTTPLMRLFVPTFQSPMSKLSKLLLIKGSKLPRKKSFFFYKFCLTSRIFLVLVLLFASVERFFVSRMRDFSHHFKDIVNKAALLWANYLVIGYILYSWP